MLLVGDQTKGSCLNVCAEYKLSVNENDEVIKVEANELHKKGCTSARERQTKCEGGLIIQEKESNYGGLEEIGCCGRERSSIRYTA